MGIHRCVWERVLSLWWFKESKRKLKRQVSICVMHPSSGRVLTNICSPSPSFQFWTTACRDMWAVLLWTNAANICLSSLQDVLAPTLPYFNWTHIKSYQLHNTAVKDTDLILLNHKNSRTNSFLKVSFKAFGFTCKTGRASVSYLLFLSPRWRISSTTMSPGEIKILRQSGRELHWSHVLEIYRGYKMN